MNDLINKKCVPCEGGVPALDLSEIHKYQKKTRLNKENASKLWKMIQEAGDYLRH